MTVSDILKDKQTLEFKVCMHCGHLQNTAFGTCEKCDAGKIGLGKSREFWVYLTLKIEGIVRLPDAGYVRQFKEEMVTGILDADDRKHTNSIKEKLADTSQLWKE